MSDANNTQVAGSHYQGEYQTWDFIDDMGLGYFEGNIVKYVQRHRKKAKSVDLGKAAHYTAKTRELLNDEWAARNSHNAAADIAECEFLKMHAHAELLRQEVEKALDKFRVANSIGTDEMEIIAAVVRWRTDEDLDHIEFLIHALDRYLYPTT